MPGPVRLADVESRARLIAATALTTGHGHRPSAVLASYVSSELFQRLTARAAANSVRSPKPVYHGRTYLCRINRHVIEATVVASDGQTTRAVAIRFEHLGGRWRACDLTII